ncbi:MAG: hypothetical protein KatS3mg002_1053 [Candidatus Woesearchaeota archaeon]|nr:MAG: hypothetical protein KatS3mg002_1053 [Candidatus Woesearchaeota archaeon]
MKIKYSQVFSMLKHNEKIKRINLKMADLLKLKNLYLDLEKKINSFNQIKDEVIAKYNLNDENELKKANAELQESLNLEIEVDYEPIEINQDSNDFNLEFLIDTEWMWKIKE